MASNPPIVEIRRFTTNPVNNWASVRDTVALMRRLVHEASQNVLAWQWARSLPVQNSSDPLQALWLSVKRLCPFRRDEQVSSYFRGHEDAEVLHHPIGYLTGVFYAGDCDDCSMLAATAAKILGIPVRFVTVAGDPGSQREMTHVYVKLWDGGKWISFDASHGDYLGWEYQGPGMRLEWEV